MDASTVVLAISVVAGIVGTEVVKEATKDAYRGFKQKLTDVLGRTGANAIARLEGDPTSSEARQALENALMAPSGDDHTELQTAIRSLIAAASADPAAMQAFDTAHITLDFEAGGDINITDVAGARKFEVKAKAGRDINFRDVEMDTGRDEGN